MKVSILTQPLGRNYGGLLQAYALQVAVKKLGCDVETLDRRKTQSHHFFAISKVKTLIKKILRFIDFMGYWRKLGNPYANLDNFRDHFISMSPLVDTERKVASYYSDNRFDAFIVGSDQVWRSCYSPSLYNFFLDFCDNLDLSSKRIAYAASFGVDYKEFSDEEVAFCRPLARRFDAISVREDSGVGLCKDYFDVNVKLVLDPTMLLEYADYEHLIENDSSLKLEKAENLLVYVLDMEDKKQAFVEEVSRITGESPTYLMNHPDGLRDESSKNNNLHPSVGDWLKNFKMAEFIVTDSFHGCVFAIIFNKPFFALGNKSRGLARFNSLLKIFGLENRLIDSFEEVDESLISNSIDWDKVNKIRDSERNKSIEFLKNSLFS